MKRRLRSSSASDHCVFLHHPERQRPAAVADQRGVAPMGDDGCVVGQAAVDQGWDRAEDVGVGVRTDQPANLVETDDIVHLADHIIGGKGRPGIDEHRLVALFDQIDVTLELVSRQSSSRPTTREAPVPPRFGSRNPVSPASLCTPSVSSGRAEVPVAEGRKVPNRCWQERRGQLGCFQRRMIIARVVAAGSGSHCVHRR